MGGCGELGEGRFGCVLLVACVCEVLWGCIYVVCMRFGSPTGGGVLEFGIGMGSVDKGGGMGVVYNGVFVGLGEGESPRSASLVRVCGWIFYMPRGWVCVFNASWECTWA